jgi:hypothetical protein
MKVTEHHRIEFAQLSILRQPGKDAGTAVQKDCGFSAVAFEKISGTSASGRGIRTVIADDGQTHGNTSFLMIRLRINTIIAYFQGSCPFHA